jgi:sterol desaturase/sphingolipid hydroxylase (fatty acid hydroxylase superfamily)
LLKLEHSTAAYRADLALYGVLSLGLAALLALGGPPGSRPALAAWALAGGTLWTLVEYLLHRFVLHGLAPFSRWHADHHDRPKALISSPTILSVGLFALLAVAPAWYLWGPWPACALSFGLITGYGIYGLTHHATHHRVPAWAQRSAWLSRRRRWHARHHAASRAGAPVGHFGVSLDFWDHVFGTHGAAVVSSHPRGRA